jgi:hypothetical protein
MVHKQKNKYDYELGDKTFAVYRNGKIQGVWSVESAIKIALRHKKELFKDKD